MKRLSKAELLAATITPRDVVALPELGGEVTVRGLTGHERDKYETDLFVQRGKNRVFNGKNARAKLIALSVITEDGQQMFTEDEVAQIGTLRADILDRLFTKAQELSGLSDKDVAELEAPSV